MHRPEDSGILLGSTMFIRRTSRATLCRLLLASTVAACSGERPAVDAWSPGREVIPPKDILTVLRESDNATLYRVTDQFSADFEEHKTKTKIADYRKIAEKPFPRALRADTSDILADGRNYLRENETWTCLRQPVYVIRASRAADTIDIIVHECGDVEIHGTISGKVRQWQHGLRASTAEGRLWSLLREVMPERPRNCCDELQQGPYHDL